MNFQALLLQVSIAGTYFFITTGISGKVRGIESFLKALPQRRWIRILCGTTSLLAGIATTVGIFVPFIDFFASCIAVIAAVLIFISFNKSQPIWSRLMPIIIILLSIGVAMIQPLGLKVLALPKAAELPYQPLDARVIKTYGEGTWFEGIAAGADGALFLASNHNLDFSRSDYYRNCQGVVIKRTRDGKEKIIFETPKGNTAGVITIADDGSLYMTSHGDHALVWHIDQSEKANILAQLPTGAWPNGLDIGPDGMLYSPDSSLGLIWRINPKNGEFEKIVQDHLLEARPIISLAPGANGLHFKDKDMYVTVSDKTTVLKYHLEPNGKFGKATIVATGIPGDDFAISNDGTLYITTHPYNTLVRVLPNGERTIVGKEKESIVGATDAVFGTGPDDRDILYVVTDGGAFTGGPLTKGQLVAINTKATKW